MALEKEEGDSEEEEEKWELESSKENDKDQKLSRRGDIVKIHQDTDEEDSASTQGQNQSGDKTTAD